MSFPLAVIQPSPLQRCARAGACCRLIPLSISPGNLRRRYESRYRERVDPVPRGLSIEEVGAFLEERPFARVLEDHPSPVRDTSDEEDDLLVIGPMLEGRCLGKVSLGWNEKRETVVAAPEGRRRTLYFWPVCQPGCR